MRDRTVDRVRGDHRIIAQHQQRGYAVDSRAAAVLRGAVSVVFVLPICHHHHYICASAG